MPRILIVDADETTASASHDALVASGHHVALARSPDEARVWVHATGADLIVADLHVAPESWPALRLELRAALEPYVVPFVFIADPSEGPALAEMLTDGTPVVALGRPCDPAHLVRTVDSVLGALERMEGSFTDDSFLHMIAQIDQERDSGVLTAYRGHVVKKVVFRDGAATFANSTDPKDDLGQVFVRAGVGDEQQLSKVMRLTQAGGGTNRLEQAFEQVAKLSKEAVRTVIESRIADTLLSLYIWQEGKWEFSRSEGLGVDEAYPACVLLQEIRTRGQERRRRWPHLRTVFADDGMTFTVNWKSFPENFPSSDTDRRLLQVAEQGYTLGQILLELRGREYVIYRKYLRWKERGYVTLNPADTRLPRRPSTSAPPITGIVDILDRARAELDRGNDIEARQHYEEALGIDPANIQARMGLRDASQYTVGRLNKQGFGPNRKVALSVPLEHLTSHGLSAGDGFVLSRLAPGALTVQDLVNICPIDENDVLLILQHWHAQQVVCFDD